MPYLVTAKNRSYELRDGTTAKDKMHVLQPGVPVLFANLPPGYSVPGDNQIEVVVAPERCEDVVDIPALSTGYSVGTHAETIDPVPMDTQTTSAHAKRGRKAKEK